MEPGDTGSANLNGSFNIVPRFTKVVRGLRNITSLRGFNHSGVPVLRGRNTLEHWRVPDAEPYLKETLNFEFCFRVCGHTLIPH